MYLYSRNGTTFYIFFVFISDPSCSVMSVCEHQRNDCPLLSVSAQNLHRSVPTAQERAQAWRPAWQEVCSC